MRPETKRRAAHRRNSSSAGPAPTPIPHNGIKPVPNFTGREAALKAIAAAPRPGAAAALAAVAVSMRRCYRRVGKKPNFMRLPPALPHVLT
jgi:hypothetical protein